jgi:hypothetical protein
MAGPTFNSPEPAETPEVPLLGVFALLIVIALVPIGFVIAVPSVLTLIVALGTVMIFAAAVSFLLVRMIGD